MAMAMAVGVAGFCSLVTLLLSSRLVADHLLHWRNAKQQTAIIIIALMPPLYALSSLAGLLDAKATTAFFSFLDALEECYEALVIAKFLALMYSYLNISMSKGLVPEGVKGRAIHVSFPMTLFVPHTLHLDHHVLKLFKWWTWQFVIIRPLFSVFVIVAQVLGFYSWGPISFAVSAVLNFSVSLALYALMLFYHAFAKELAPHNPLAKFLCVKGIVFFSFWQGIVLEILAALGIIRADHVVWLEVDQIEEAIQNLLICVEMVFFAFAQNYAFSAVPYSRTWRRKGQEKEEASSSELLKKEE